jgi:hypothetical protein
MTMPEPRLIGLGGLKRSGKDTLAEHWSDRWGYVVMGMSDPLLNMALALNPLIPVPGRESKYGREDEPTTYQRLSTLVARLGYVGAKEIPEVRAFLQRLGTDVGREMIDQDLWVKQAEAAIQKHWDEGRAVVLTGIRFPNEVELVRRLAGRTLYLTRGSLSADDSHTSETSVGSADFEWSLENDFTLANLYSEGDDILRQMGNEALRGERFAFDKAVTPPWMGVRTYKATADFAAIQGALTDAKQAIERTNEARRTIGQEGHLSTEERKNGGPDLNSDGTVRKTPLTQWERSHIRWGQSQGRVVLITDDRVRIEPEFTEEKQAEHARLVGLAEAQGWLAEVQPDGSVVTRHPIDWVTHPVFPDGYTRMTRDPHEPLECMKCGARYVNHLQHTKWHDSLSRMVKD